METLEIEIIDNGKRISLRGCLNENSGPPLNDCLKTMKTICHIDLRGIDKINSIGIGIWLDFTKKAAINSNLILESCSPDFIYQMNMISNFRENVTVNSCMRYFSCEACNFESTKEYKALVHYNENGVMIANSNCERCGETVEFGETDDEFFHFARRE